MSREYCVLTVLAVASILLLTVCGRTSKPRESLFLFLVNQAVTWPLTIITVYLGSMESPVRLFPKATDSNFIMAFVFFPAVFVAYYWHYPRDKNRVIQIAYTLAITGGSALVHVAVQKYTDLLLYINFTGYRLWLMGIVWSYLIRIYADWYLGQLTKERSGNPQ